MRITKIERKLSDGSKVYGLTLSISGSSFVDIPCITQADADHLAEKIGMAIEQHSLEEVTYAFDEVA